MTIGLAVSKVALDQDVGQIALDLRNVFRRIEQMRHYLLITPDGTLTGMTYSAAEVATLKAAFADGDQLRLIWSGLASQAALQDFRLNLDQLPGQLVT